MVRTKKHSICFLIKHCLFALMLLGVLFLGGCGKAAEEVPGEAFLSAFYTSNQGGRYDAFLTSFDAGTPDVDAYRASLSSLCTEACYTSFMMNRLPVRYDKYASQYGCAFTPQEVTVSSADGNGQVTFSVVLSIAVGDEEIGTVSQSGNLTLKESGDLLLVDSLWIDDMDALGDFLKEQFPGV